MHQINLGNINIDIIAKDIKNVHLAVLPPLGRVRISAPKRMNLETIRMFAITKLDWIRKNQAKMLNQSRESARDYISGESHYFLGKRYLLKVVNTSEKPNVLCSHNNIILNIKQDSNKENKQKLLQEFYRKQLKEILLRMIEKYEKSMNLKVEELQIRKMRTRWGSCNPRKKKIIINLELVKKPLQCLEYVITHEMVHFFERKHNKKFISYMDKFLPNWRHCKQNLNLLPTNY
jgi:predicted metal-dependent hydrolase